MSAAEVLALALPSVVSGAGIFALKAAFASREAQGKRIGAVEKWIDIETGRRQGFAEGMAAARVGSQAPSDGGR